MNEKTILNLMNQISLKLDEGEAFIKNNQWDEVGTLFKQAVDLQDKIKKNNPSPETMILKNASFKEEYESKKGTLLNKTKNIISLIESWKVEQTSKISGSKTLMNNLSNYYKSSNNAYYIDTKE